MISGKRSRTFTVLCSQVGDLCAWSFPGRSSVGCGHCTIGTRSGFFPGLERKWRMTRPASMNISLPPSELPGPGTIEADAPRRRLSSGHLSQSERRDRGDSCRNEIDGWNVQRVRKVIDVFAVRLSDVLRPFTSFASRKKLHYPIVGKTYLADFINWRKLGVPGNAYPSTLPLSRSSTDQRDSTMCSLSCKPDLGRFS